ncbi:MAG TPA: hypothetical protein VH370_01830 [Humisphaera sp.]|jgi:hypothetical protein|nr:hypothetical protein [Humisphaera sp.]
MKTILLSASDQGYFQLLKGLVLSIHANRPDSQIAIGAIDLGMTDAQISELRSLNVMVAPGKWDFDFPGREQMARWFQAMTARCCLPQYFPGYELYIWIDADAWLADWRTVELLVAAASPRALLALVPEMHRAYRNFYHLGDTQQIDHHRGMLMTFGEEMARKLGLKPVMNSGVFAARHDSPVWGVWAKWMRLALKGQIHSLTEQCALNAAIYIDGVAIHALPAWCNWMCGQALPAYDVAQKRFVEPNLPCDPISILHVSPRARASSMVTVFDSVKGTIISSGKPKTLRLDYLAHLEQRETIQ